MSHHKSNPLPVMFVCAAVAGAIVWALWISTQDTTPTPEPLAPVIVRPTPAVIPTPEPTPEPKPKDYCWRHAESAALYARFLERCSHEPKPTTLATMTKETRAMFDELTARGYLHEVKGQPVKDSHGRRGRR